MWNFSKIVLDALVAAGWRECRHIDISPVVELLVQSGFTAHSAARAFLAEFGDLRVRSTVTDGDYVWGHWADFDVPAALQWIEPRDQQTLHRLFGPGLCPIGETGGGSLWISEKSEVIGEYLIYDTATRSRSVEEAFEALFTCRNPAYETHVLHDDGARVEVSIAPWARGEETSASKP